MSLSQEGKEVLANMSIDAKRLYQSTAQEFSSRYQQRQNEFAEGQQTSRQEHMTARDEFKHWKAYGEKAKGARLDILRADRGLSITGSKVGRLAQGGAFVQSVQPINYDLYDIDSLEQIWLREYEGEVQPDVLQTGREAFNEMRVKIVRQSRKDFGLDADPETIDRFFSGLSAGASRKEVGKHAKEVGIELDPNLNPLFKHHLLDRVNPLRDDRDDEVISDLLAPDKVKINETIVK